MCKEIPLANGRGVAMVDDEDFELVSRFKWYQTKYGRSTQYAAAQVGQGRQRVLTTMHRLILGAQAGQVVDHINRDGLDNRRGNLRICTHADNLANRGLPKNNTSGFKGVSFCKRTRRWSCQLSRKGKQIWIGRFDSAEEAARAYDEAAIEHFGPFAYLNFPATEKESV